MAHDFLEMDVFGLAPLMGNPLAVVFDADDIPDDTMQCFARWTNFSETTFVLRPRSADAAYRLRIFTPVGELPFAGHPSIGTAFAMRATGRLTATADFVQECAAGLLTLRWLDDGACMVRVPSPKLQSLPQPVLAQLCEALGTPTLSSGFHVNVGAQWQVLQLANAEAVLALRPDFAALALAQAGSSAVGVSVYGDYSEASPYAIAVRSFAPGDGIDEDPVCGSGNAAVAAVRYQLGQVPALGGYYRAAQGRCVARDGLVQVCVDRSGCVEIGGQARVTVQGRVQLL